MRLAPTTSELVLWQAIRGRQLGVQLRPQVLLGGRYIADFVAEHAGLVVEVDGGYHDERVARDARRDTALRRAGYRVLRVPAELVMADLEALSAAVLSGVRFTPMAESWVLQEQTRTARKGAAARRCTDSLWSRRKRGAIARANPRSS